MEELTQLEVGKEYNIFKKPYNQGDGCVLEKVVDSSYFLSVYLTNMTKEEELLLRKGKITVKAITENDFVLCMVQFASSPLIFEISFDPALYKDERSDFMDKATSNMITLVGVEGSNNIIKALRYMNMPRKMFELYILNFAKAKTIEDYSSKYVRWVNDLDSRYSVLDLWDRAEYIGKMGETY